jgi:hypothetical protein
MKPTEVGYYAAWYPKRGGGTDPRVVFCYPGKGEELVCESPDPAAEPYFRPISDPCFATVSWRGPFRTRLAAEAALKADRPAS